MNKKYILVSGLIITMVTIAIVFMNQRRNPAEESKMQKEITYTESEEMSQEQEISKGIPIEEPDETAQIDTSDWQIYKNEEYWYEIKYPHGFQIDSTNPKNVFIGNDLVHRGPNGVSLKILNESIDIRISSIFSYVTLDRERGLMSEILENKEVYIDGTIGRKIVVTNPIGYNDLYYFLNRNGINYELSGINNNEYHDEILLNFRFLKR